MHISLTILTRIHVCIQKVFLTLRFVKYVHCVYNVVRQYNVHTKIYIKIYDVNILCIDIFLYLSFFYLRKHITIHPIFFVVAQLAKLRYSVYVYKRMQRLTTAATTVIEQSSSDFFLQTMQFQ